MFLFMLNQGSLWIQVNYIIKSQVILKWYFIFAFLFTDFYDDEMLSHAVSYFEQRTFKSLQTRILFFQNSKIRILIFYTSKFYVFKLEVSRSKGWKYAFN